MDTKKILFLGLVLMCFSSFALASASYNSPNDGENIHYDQSPITHSFDVVGTDGTIELYIDGSFVESWSHCDGGCSQTYNYDKSYSKSDAGQHTWDVVYYGSTDGSDADPSTQSYTIQDDADATTLEALNPDNAETLLDNSVSYEYRVGGKSGEVELVSDTCVASNEVIDTYFYDGGYVTETVTNTENFDCYGDFNWYLRYIGDDGSTKESFGDYFVIEKDSSQASIDYIGPNDNDNIDGDINQEASITYDFDFTGPSGDLYLREDGQQIESFSHPGGSNVNYEETVTNDDGSYDWNVEYEADDGSSVIFGVQSYDIEDYADRADLNLDSPADNAGFSSSSVTFDYGNSGGGDGDVELYVDGNLEASDSYSDGQSLGFSNTVSSLSDGSHSWYVEYEGDDGSSTTSNTRSFDLDTSTDAEESSISLLDPSDGATFTGVGSTVSYDAEVSGNSGTVKIFSDTCSNSNSEIYSTSYGGSSSFAFGTDKIWNCEGTFDWYAKYIGDDGSTKSTNSDSFTINSDASETSISMNDPSDGSTVTYPDGNVDFIYSGTGESGSIELYVDGSLESTDSFSAISSNFYNKTVSLASSGSHSWYVKYIGDDGSSKSLSTNNFDLQTTYDSEKTSISLNRPSNGEVYKTNSVEYNWSIDGESGSVEVYRNGSKIGDVSYDGSGSQTLSYSETLSNGDYSYYLKYVGDDGSTKSTNTRSFSVDVPMTSSISLDSPADKKDFKSTFPISINYSFQVSGEAGTVEIFRDGNVVRTFTHPKGQYIDYSYSESFNQEGNHTWYVKYTRDSDSQVKNSLTREYSVIQQESVSLSIQSPSKGASFEYDESVNFDYSASSNVIGSVDLLLNGSSVKSNNYASPGSTSFYSYEASDLSGDSYNATVRFTSDDGNKHFSDYVNFTVEDRPVNYIENVEVKYRGVDSGSIDKGILVNLTGNSSIDDYEAVSGDTASFSSDEWVIENISVPYEDDLVVYDTEGRNDSRSLDFNVSVKNVSGHPENANLSYQEKNRTISVQNDGSTFNLNYSCNPDAGYGDPVEVDSIGQVMAGSSSSFACRWSGDWINHSAGKFSPTVSSVDIDDLLPMSSWIEINNSASVSFPSVKYPEIVPEPTCSTTRPISVGNNSEVNETAKIECGIGDSGEPRLTIDGSDYKWNTTLNLSNDLTENITLTWDTNKSKLSDWENKDPGSSIAYFKGVSDDILLAESTSSVKIIVPDGTFSGGIGEGLHPARIEYDVGSSSGSGSPGGGSGGDTPRIIRNVTGKYNWSVSAPRSEGQTFYNVVGWGGRDLGNAPTRIVVRNLGTGNFTVEARCVSEDNSCDFIELSENNITLDELENDRQVVQVEGVIPQEIPEDGYRFNIVFEDPEGKELETNFRINQNYAQSLIIRFISKVFGVREVDFDGDGGGDPVPIPLALPVFLITGLFWVAVALFIRFAQSNNMLEDDMDFTRGRIIASVVIFILAFIFI
jgi:hypothetical protein